MTQLGIEPTTSHTPGERSTAGPPGAVSMNVEARSPNLSVLVNVIINSLIDYFIVLLIICFWQWTEMSKSFVVTQMSEIWLIVILK